MVGNETSNRAPERPSAAVYRRRRIVAGILVLLVLIGLVAGISAAVNMLRGDDSASATETTEEATLPGPDSQQPGAAPAGTAAPTAPAASPAATASATAAPALCPPASVGVSATTDALSYTAGVAPMLTMTVTNTGAEACDVNVGTSQMEFIITSGSDRIFSSADCQQAGEDLFKTIKPNTVETAKFSWDRQRSAPGCSEVASNPNPGTYSFTARLGNISSERTTFELE
ncbi:MULTISPECIES: hypothetical protein [Arthrobacter]|uniref:DUF4232 domain-containing protein n=1 Tax=Arthrobacter sunyaminii TaxID=2816859 RepID=A0A975S5V3_9MICC|nr:MULTISPECIES: hypothetical protein [Arthrobacter]MBO0909293.1 hypothetical protein [Arthrobacter sunyaminii]QWQ36376.1 hypothetical protein KG104_00555 [Arthrobacter sunyaminii]